MKIRELILFTTQPEAMKAFYTDLLGFTLISSGSSEFGLKVGNSTLRFKQSKTATPYHFAFNIPPYSETQALNWLEDRVTVLVDGDNKIQVFENWQARAIYFYDPDQNIVEFIARRSLEADRSDMFSADSIINISEIGLPVNHVRETCDQLSRENEIPVYDGDLERFAALGDEEGLFICINKNIKRWFPTNDLAYSSNFNIIFEVKEQTCTAGFVDGQLRLNS